MAQVISNINVKMFTLINNFADRNLVLDKTMIFISKFASILISLLIGWIITLFYFHPGPFMVGLGNELILHSSDTSFPGDHTTVIFATAFTLIFLR